MAEVKLTHHAQQDLADIWDYLAERNPAAAHKLIDALIHRFKLLAKNPQTGKACHELLLNLRRVPHKNYAIFYLPTENGIEIYRVLHGSRDIPPIFEAMLPQ